MVVSTYVRSARKSRRFTQVRLSEVTRIDQAALSRIERGRDATVGTVDRLLAAVGHSLVLVPTVRADVATLAPEIRAALRQGDKGRALRSLIQLNDNLVAEHGLVRGVLAVAEPELVGDRVWDAAIAALVAWRLGEEGLPSPDWVDFPDRILMSPQVLEVDSADPIPTASDAPPEFLAHGVLAWRDTFESV